MDIRPILSRRPRADGRNPDSEFWYGPVSKPTAAGVSVTTERALQLTVVYDCVQVLSQTIGALPHAIFERARDGSKTRKDDHPLATVLRDPNPETTDVEFFGQMVFDLATEGNAFVEPRGGDRGPISELWRLDPQRTRVERLSDGSKRFVETGASGSDRQLTEDQVWHLRLFPHTHDGLRGMSPVHAGREAIAAAIAVQDFAARFFQNDCTPPFVLEHPSHFASGPDRESFLEAVKRWWGGSRRHSPGLLEHGIKLNRVGVNNDEAQFLETKNALDHSLARIWHMPPHKVGLMDKATFSNIEQQALEFVTDTLLPWLKLIERSVAKHLMLGRDAERFVFEFNVAGLLRGDLVTRYQAFAQGRQWGWLSVNDVRKLENMNPVAGGDAYLTPLNMVPQNGTGQSAPPQRAESVVYGPGGDVVSRLINGNVVRIEDYRHVA